MIKSHKYESIWTRLIYKTLKSLYLIDGTRRAFVGGPEAKMLKNK